MNPHFKLLISNVAFFGVGLALIRGASFLGIPLLTHSIRDPQVFGYFDLVFAFASVLAGVANFGITEATYKLYFDRKTDHGRSSVIATSIVASIVSSLIIGVLFLTLIWILGNQVPLLSASPGLYACHIFAFALALRLRHAVEIPYMLKNKRVKVVSVNAFETILFFVAIWALLSFTGSKHSVDILVVARVFALISGIVLLSVTLKPRLEARALNKNFLVALLIIGGPLAAGSLFYSLLSISDRFSISYFLGAGALGAYAVVAKFAAVGEFIRSSFNQGFWFFFFKSSEESNHEKRMSLLLEGTLIFITFLFFVSSLSSERIFMSLIATEFQAAHVVLGELIVSPLLLGGAQMVGASLIKAGKTWSYTLCQILGVITNIVLTCYLTSKIGIRGAAFATVVGYLLMLCVVLLAVKQSCLQKLEIKNSLYWITLLLASILFHVLSSQIFFIYWLSFVVLATLFLYAKKMYALMRAALKC